MVDGIYTFANDVVFDQLVALLNSIEVNAGRDIPVCIIPFNDQLEKVQAEIARRKNVTLFDQPESIAFWEDFATQAWLSHPTAQRVWKEQGRPTMRRANFHRKFCCFDGQFDRFLYIDADTLLMGSVDPVFEKLDQYDWIVNDYQYLSDASLIFNTDSEALLEQYSLEKLRANIFCSGFFASKKSVYNQEKAKQFLERLKAGEADFMSLRGSDQPMLNYTVLGNQISFFNFAYHDPENATGSHWSSQFSDRNHILYDDDKRLMYLHYMSISSSVFTRLCQGENVPLAYRDLFLHYRYLKFSQDRPQEFKSPSAFTQARSRITKFRKQKISNLNHRFRKLKHQLNKLRG
ncbi:Npun_R2821/Npun_R2822 family protein [Leptolyngbya sp. FACHB-17]|uniref:Npun_R2821/Npun_R2822 family protein n=1 Tax=unclassified Leptolyngbya TaxID=2650499 RepID=UPI001681321A|nr:Npun_R2821/Npun_R2822 family protein [Leptolyngbya sp. FACHB-17]MBD2082024.1 sugar transferase [Leptolyngbya sp. FACHB-17]